MFLKYLFEKVIGRDILFFLKSENLIFYNYNYVLVFYCSSDLWFGKKLIYWNGFFDFVNDLFVDNFSFKGYMIFCLVFKDLYKNYNILFLEEIVVLGSSVGGIGVLNYVSWFIINFISYLLLKFRFFFIIDLVWFIDF